MTNYIYIKEDHYTKNSDGTLKPIEVKGLDEVYQSDLNPNLTWTQIRLLLAKQAEENGLGRRFRYNIQSEFIRDKKGNTIGVRLDCIEKHLVRMQCYFDKVIIYTLYKGKPKKTVLFDYEYFVDGEC